MAKEIRALVPERPLEAEDDFVEVAVAQALHGLNLPFWKSEVNFILLPFQRVWYQFSSNSGLYQSESET